jgi:hypothetical protein
MITKEEFDYIKVVLRGALMKGTRLADKEEGREMAIVDVDAVMGAVDACWDSLVPPAYREGK